MIKIKFAVGVLFASLLGSGVALAEGMDGRYTASIGFKMGPASVCPSVLPITIEIEVSGSNVSGVIINDGGENTHRFCALYHNGTISGKIDENGEFVKVRIKQNDAHSREFSSYQIKGNLNGQLSLISRAPEFHPKANFSLVKR